MLGYKWYVHFLLTTRIFTKHIRISCKINTDYIHIVYVCVFMYILYKWMCVCILFVCMYVVETRSLHTLCKKTHSIFCLTLLAMTPKETEKRQVAVCKDREQNLPSWSRVLWSDGTTVERFGHHDHQDTWRRKKREACRPEPPSTCRALRWQHHFVLL